MFLLLFAIFDMTFCKDFPTFYGQIKRKRGTFPSRITNPWKLFKPSKPKGLLSFSGKSKCLGGLHILVIREHKIVMDVYQNYCRKLDNFFSRKQQGVRTEQKTYSLLTYNF